MHNWLADDDECTVKLMRNYLSSEADEPGGGGVVAVTLHGKMLEKGTA